MTKCAQTLGAKMERRITRDDVLRQPIIGVLLNPAVEKAGRADRLCQ